MAAAVAAGLVEMPAVEPINNASYFQNSQDGPQGRPFYFNTRLRKEKGRHKPPFVFHF
jgi:hypothetical protein